MRVIIAGSRSVKDYKLIEEAVEESGFNIDVVVSGNARGVDQLGEWWARNHKKDISLFPAEWDKHGLSAGFKRNVEMAEFADALIAIWDGRSKGTKHMITTAKKYKLSIYIKQVG